MNKREKAIRLMEDIRKSAPRPLIDSISNEDKGINFILGYLKCHKDRENNIVDLAKELGVSTARISVLIRKMENKELVRKTRSKTDARKVMVKISARGERIADANFEMMVKAHEKLIECVSEDDLKNFVRVSGIIKDVMEDTKAGYER
ncbi:MAG: MarR family transcriptional regulator [Erysipelotrichaceae bacterium]|nr:MarR family transcriptional regulator [Erysipelotrichaceae bacterium]